VTRRRASGSGAAGRRREKHGEPGLVNLKAADRLEVRACESLPHLAERDRFVVPVSRDVGVFVPRNE
jgi:hypothetical protein